MDDIPTATDQDDEMGAAGGETLDDGPTENLLEKGKKIALEDF